MEFIVFMKSFHFSSGSYSSYFSFNRLDVRGKSLNTALHDSASEVFGTRAYFRTTAEPAFLSVEDIRRHDQGLYRCRVDFRNSATKSFRYNLTIIGKYNFLQRSRYSTTYKRSFILREKVYKEKS